MEICPVNLGRRYPKKINYVAFMAQFIWLLFMGPEKEKEETETIL